MNSQDTRRARSALAVAVACVASGLRNRIVVTNQRVVVTRLWLFLPYWKQAGGPIQDVWYNGDWGEPEGATGVTVVCSGAKEFHIGSPRTMDELHDALTALTPSATEHERSKAKAQAHDPQTF